MAEPLDECCGRCGAILPAGRVEGLCPVCLLEDSQDLFGPEFPEDGAGVEAPAPVKGAGLLNLRGYTVLREIDRGGMGIVYEARQAFPVRRVAVKMLLPHLLEAGEMRERFRREAQSMSSLDHSGVLPVYEVGEHGGLPFFCMKLASGGSLQRRVGEYRGRWRDSAALTAHLADAVQCAHDHGLLHRDLKPGNILFDEAGKAYVTDFGLAKRTDAALGDMDLTRTTAVLGTPHYLAPEWASGASRTATTAGDVYGLGAILYFLLAGRPPHYNSDCLPALLKEIAETPPPPLDAETPRDLAIICHKAMEKEPSRRYGSAAALAEDLRRWLEGRPILARPASAGEKLWRLARRNPLPASLALALALAVTIGGAALWKSWLVGRARLHDSLVAQAAVMRETAQIEHRGEALTALSEAADLRFSAVAREEMISALALPVWREVRRIPYEDLAPDAARRVARINGVEISPPVADAGFTRYVYFERDGRVSVRRWSDGREICRLPEEVANPHACGPFSPDGRLLCVRRVQDERVRLWDCEEKRWIGNLSPGHSPVFTPDGRVVVTVGSGMLHPLSVPEIGRAGNPCPVGFDDVPRAYGFCSEGVRMIVGEKKTSRFKLMDMRTGKEIFSARNPHAAGPRCAAWHPDGQSIFLGAEDSRIYRWPVSGEAVPEVFAGHAAPVMALAVDHSGDWMISQSKDGVTRLWSTVTGKTVATLPYEGELAMMKPGPKGAVRVLCEDRRERCLVEFSLSPSPVCRQFTVPHRQLADRSPRGAWNVTFSPDGGLLSIGDTDGVWHYDPVDGARLGHAPLGHCWSLGWQRDGGAFYSASATGLQRWETRLERDPATGAPRATLLPPGEPWATNEKDHRLHHLSLSHDGKLLAVSRDHCAELYSVPEGRLLRQVAVTKPAAGNLVDMISLCPGSRLLAMGRRKENRASIWNTGDGSFLREVVTENEEPAVLFSNRGGSLFIGDPAKLICTDLRTGKTLWTRPREKRSGDTMVLAQSGDGALLAASLAPDVVHLLDAATGREYIRLRHPFPGRTAWLAFSSDGGRLAVLCMRRQVQVWDLRALRRILAGHDLDWKAPPLPPPAPPRLWSVREVKTPVGLSVPPPPAEPDEAPESR